MRISLTLGPQPEKKEKNNAGAHQPHQSALFMRPF
jgi:hypothetical protein